MPLAAALGMGTFADTPWANASGLREENVVLVGLRSVDEPERERIRDSAITAYTMSDIDQCGVVDVTASSSHQQDQVGRAGVELVGQQVAGRVAKQVV